MAMLDDLPELEEFQLDQHTSSRAQELMAYAAKLCEQRKRKAAGKGAER